MCAFFIHIHIYRYVCMYESFWDFEWPLDASSELVQGGGDCDAEQVESRLEMWPRDCGSMSRHGGGRLIGCSLQSWMRIKRLAAAAAAVFPAGNNNATALCCHGTSTKDVICCRRSSRQNSYTWNCGPQPCYFFFVCWCLSKESWVVYSLFLLNMVTCLWLASFVVANDGTPCSFWEIQLHFYA